MPPPALDLRIGVLLLPLACGEATKTTNTQGPATSPSTSGTQTGSGGAVGGFTSVGGTPSGASGDVGTGGSNPGPSGDASGSVAGGGSGSGGVPAVTEPIKGFGVLSANGRNALLMDYAKKLNPNLRVSILRWNSPGWVANNDQVFTWYKNTTLAAYRTAGNYWSMAAPRPAATWPPAQKACPSRVSIPRPTRGTTWPERWLSQARRDRRRPALAARRHHGSFVGDVPDVHTARPGSGRPRRRVSR